MFFELFSFPPKNDLRACALLRTEVTETFKDEEDETVTATSKLEAEPATKAVEGYFG